jgi:cell division transport system ATP-binding protein
MIIFENVTKLYDEKVVGMLDCTFHIPKGEFVFLVGPSGSGKSTLIKLVLRELEPTKGRVVVAGRNLATLRRSKVPLLRRNIGCVFQDFKLLPSKTVYENVAYALEVVGESNKNIRRKVPEILKLVGLYEKMNSLPSEISGGEEQRVSIARAFVNHPPLLLADEPTGNLDPDTSVGIMQLLERINRTGTTVVVATHDREMVNHMRKRVFALEGGRLVRDERRGGYDETGEIPIVGPATTGAIPVFGPGTTGAIPIVNPATTGPLPVVNPATTGPLPVMPAPNGPGVPAPNGQGVPGYGQIAAPPPGSGQPAPPPPGHGQPGPRPAGPQIDPVTRATVRPAPPTTGAER